jgi:hypothetical protein
MDSHDDGRRETITSALTTTWRGLINLLGIQLFPASVHQRQAARGVAVVNALAKAGIELGENRSILLTFPFAAL